MSQQAPLLPPIEHFGAQRTMQSQQQSQHPPQQHPPPPSYPLNGAPMQSQQHPPPYPPPQYQYQNGAMPSNGQQNGMHMRFPIPPQPSLGAQQMPGGRHKKEIKRRTKTGCLTCRKRRIKCDEGHPTCRNCQKSKRECLGYDPIFKQQPGPANIQPAPVGNPPPPANPSAPPTTVPSNPYQTPQSFPGTGGTFIPAAGAPYGSAEPPFEHSTSLDPALSGADPHLHMAQNNHSSVQPQRKVKAVQMQELFSLNDIPPQYNQRDTPVPLSPQAKADVEPFYKFHYALGLDRLFETTWYSSRGLSHLESDASLQDYVSQAAEQFKTSNDNASAKPLRSLEARLVWLLACMPRSAATNANGAGSDPILLELLPRIDTVENLLTGQFLENSRIPPPPQQPPSQPHQDSAPAAQKYNEQSFWHNLGRFVSIRDDHPAAVKDINDALAVLRGILSMLENRDVLYSIAIARHIGGRMPEFHPQRHLVASTNDQNDDINKLKVAHQFVEGEDQRGTTQVIQRVCSMAIRSWILQKQ
ncbi:hypothetical protein M409DRAFT_63549 [Zasmidium cellare ATCC 36951]|uniref:Zn(2)-C6 fungal-type domain-containing protein n=1 Tax=Zasmidium cellare ATCC 36951 TaxID=1080233 RepID=A0A6A6CVN0_ZASCE|nr:uncharacterized protein M409DRAFT_63549 [Zasmidium cellare ATCC 36951]KAF2171171.1 hypothetical protein M409DRAFT_63549 [Zasmidium cellare ATCC 36951]